jgi:hypothetical protein
LRHLDAARAKGRKFAKNTRFCGWHGHCIGNQTETLSRQPTEKGDANMFKKIFIALGIVALTSTSAFAAKASHKAPAAVTAQKVAQADSAKAADAKGKKGKKGKKAAEEAPAAAPAPAPAPAPAAKK